MDSKTASPTWARCTGKLIGRTVASQLPTPRLKKFGSWRRLGRAWRYGRSAHSPARDNEYWRPLAGYCGGVCGFFFAFFKSCCFSLASSAGVSSLSSRTLPLMASTLTSSIPFAVRISQYQTTFPFSLSLPFLALDVGRLVLQGGLLRLFHAHLWLLTFAFGQKCSWAQQEQGYDQACPFHFDRLLG